MKTRKMLFSAVIAGIVMVAPCLASMSWSRGDPGSTWQDWTFNDGANPKVADAYFNSYGIPTASITPLPGTIPPFMIGWHSSWDGRQGVWVGDPVKIDLTIPNTPFTGGYKEVWMEVGFEGIISAGFPILSAPGTVTEIPGSRTVTPAEGQWKILTIGWTIVPNPQREAIFASFAGTGGFVDYIKVDTICVPAPAGLLFLLPGAIWLRRRRSA
jgi:hypothetical protein